MDHDSLHARARSDAGQALYSVCRPIVDFMLRFYWRVSKQGRQHIPASGPAIIASNHRSFMDPWVIGTMADRPIYYMAKAELFKYRPVAWFLNSVGAFPVRRGQGDGDTISTAKELLARGEIVLVFVEGTRTRPGPLGKPKRGVGRLAVESGAPVVPLAIIGTEKIRQKYWLRPDKITVRAGAPLQFEQAESASSEAAQAVVDAVWPRVHELWEQIGGAPAAVPLGAGESAAAAPATAVRTPETGPAEPDVQAPARVA